MNRHIKRIALAGVALLLLMLLVPMLFQKKIGEQALAAVQKQLRTELSVESYSLSLLRDFPYASVGLDDVTLGGYPEGTLITAKRLSGRVSYYDLLFAEGWIINTVTLEDAELNILRSPKKIGNWSILHPKTDTASTSEFNFALSRIIFDNTNVEYEDLSNLTHGSFHIDDGELSGEFRNAAYVLKGILNGKSHFLDLADYRYIEDFQLSTNIELKTNPKENSYLFGPSTITLDGMPIDISGTIGFIKNSTAYDLKLATEEGRLGPLLKALPQQWIGEGIRSLDTRGAFSLSGTIAGLYDKRTSPAITFAGKLREGSLDVPALKRSAEEVSFSLSYTNGKAHSMADSKLVLTNILATLDGQPLNGSFTWSNFSDPYYDINTTGTLPLNWLNELVDQAEFEGELGFNDLRIKGRQRHLVNAKHARFIKTSGELVPLEAKLNYANEVFAIDAEKIKVQDANLLVTKGQLAAMDNQLGVELELKNIVPYLLGNQDQTLGIYGSLETPQIDLDKWVGVFSSADSDMVIKGSEVAVSTNEKLAKGFAARLTLTADEVLYNLVRGKDFQGECVLEDSSLELKGEGFAMEGHWSIDGAIDLLTEPRLSAKLACSEVNMTELLEQAENFGQEVIESRHLSGQMTTRAYIEAAWSSEGKLLGDELHVWSNIGLTDGILQDMDMLQALSKYVRSDDLAHINFTDVENWIEIEGSTVYLPAMFIQSSATNFIVAGEHSFDHDIDYSIRVNGAQVILTKLFGKRPGMKYVPDRRSGWVKTNFKIDGSLVGDDYDVRMAGNEVRKHFRFSQRRKASIRKKLVSLFGAESLIDDYDDEGLRIKGRPQRSRTSIYAERYEDENHSAARAEGGAELAVEVDTDLYLEGWDDDDAEQQDLRRSDRDQAILVPKRERALDLDLDQDRGITDKANAADQPRPRNGKQEGLLEGLFGNSKTKRKPKKAPAEFKAPTVDEDGFLEGFDDVENGGNPDE